jgi:Xaa-Pro aminopeptidase
MLLPKGFLLLDSGAQYQDGTTDITRTIPLGPLTDEQRKIYTLVLRSHIRLEMAKFPELATGTQIDAICREPLWEHGLNFLHGTGHGVGSFLSVHEGPHQIRMEYVKTPLVAGMTVTDEPGIYVKGKFGVRIENTLLIKKYKDTDFGSFLQMEPLTLCPIDVEPIISELMEPKEINWLNNYHKLVNEKLSPYLNSEEKTWLEAETRPI